MIIPHNPDVLLLHSLISCLRTVLCGVGWDDSHDEEAVGDEVAERRKAAAAGH